MLYVQKKNAERIKVLHINNEYLFKKPFIEILTSTIFLL